MTHLILNVFGKVQGVFFRASTLQKAVDLNVKGFVKNEKDGSVYIEAEGEKEALDQFYEWCKQGPQHAVVSKVDKQYGTAKMFSSFEIQ